MPTSGTDYLSRLVVGDIAGANAAFESVVSAAQAVGVPGITRIGFGEASRLSAGWTQLAGLHGCAIYDLGISTQLQAADESAWTELASGTRTRRLGSRWRDYVVKRLDRIESGLDREGHGPYPDARVVKEARLFAESTFTARTPTPNVVPSEEGGVSFVWHKGGFDFDIEVGGDDDEVFVCLYHSASKTSFYGSGQLHLDVAKAVLESLSNLP